MSDPFDLQRFVDAQEPVYRRVVEELRRGRKASHWMWFVFPQIAGLGFSAMAQRFAIGSRVEVFQDVARGHFTVHRLERLYGKEAIRAEYDAIAAEEKIAS